MYMINPVFFNVAMSKMSKCSCSQVHTLWNGIYKNYKILNGQETLFFLGIFLEQPKIPKVRVSTAKELVFLLIMGLYKSVLSIK